MTRKGMVLKGIKSNEEENENERFVSIEWLNTTLKRNDSEKESSWKKNVRRRILKRGEKVRVKWQEKESESEMARERKWEWNGKRKKVRVRWQERERVTVVLQLLFFSLLVTLWVTGTRPKSDHSIEKNSIQEEQNFFTLDWIWTRSSPFYSFSFLFVFSSVKIEVNEF